MDASLPTLIASRSSFYRENAALMYNSGAYVLANFVVELPWLAGIVLAGTSIGYFMIGLVPSAAVFFTHYLSTYALALVLVSFGQAVAATMPSFDTAQAVVGILAPSAWQPRRRCGRAPAQRCAASPPPLALLTPLPPTPLVSPVVLFLFGGMFSKPSSMPPGSKWLNTIDPIVRWRVGAPRPLPFFPPCLQLPYLCHPLTFSPPGLRLPRAHPAALSLQGLQLPHH